MEKIIIYGSGHHSELCHHYIDQDPKYEVIAFTVKKEYLSADKLLGLPVIPFENLPKKYAPEENKLFIAIGPQRLNCAREEIYLESKNMGYKLINCISPQAFLFPDLPIGDNVFIDPGTGLHPFVQVGNNVSLIDSSIGHHCKIGDNVFISSSIVGGNATIENNVFIGLNSVIKENTRIGKGSIIGMGSIIKQDVPEYSVFSPAGTKMRAIDARKVSLF